MRDFWKRTALLAAIGLAVGLLIALFFIVLEGGRAFVAERGGAWVLAYALICGAMGMLNLGTTTIYDVERWSITRCTLTHFAICVTTLSGLGLFLGWFRSAMILYMLVPFTIGYFVIWLFMYLFYKRKVRRMNEDLKRWKDAQGGE